jgi:hypothetical protein
MVASMNDYILLMHDDVPAGANASNGDGWGRYFTKLRESGRFEGGSSIGTGVCVSKAGAAKPVTSHLSGYIRVRAESLDDARSFVAGNPVFEAGGTVEIRELPRD